MRARSKLKTRRQETTFGTKYFLLKKLPLLIIVSISSRVLRKVEDNRRGCTGAGIIAAWAYGLHSISPEIDNITHLLYEDILGSYWPKERKIVENKYQDIPFPFHNINTPTSQIELDWDLSELLGY